MIAQNRKTPKTWDHQNHKSDNTLLLGFGKILKILKLEFFMFSNILKIVKPEF